MFVFTQTVQHRDFFLPVESGDHGLPDDDADGHADPPSDRIALTSLGLLVVALVASSDWRRSSHPSSRTPSRPSASRMPSSAS